MILDVLAKALNGRISVYIYFFFSTEKFDPNDNLAISNSLFIEFLTFLLQLCNKNLFFH